MVVRPQVLLGLRPWKAWGQAHGVPAAAVAAAGQQLVNRHPVLLREWGVTGVLRWEHNPSRLGEHLEGKWVGLWNSSMW